MIFVVLCVALDAGCLVCSSSCKETASIMLDTNSFGGEEEFFQLNACVRGAMETEG